MVNIQFCKHDLFPTQMSFLTHLSQICFVSVMFGKNLWHFSVIGFFFKKIFDATKPRCSLESSSITSSSLPRATSQDCLPWLESCCVRTLKCSLRSKNPLNTEVSRRNTELLGLPSPDFSEWLSPLRPHAGFCL